MISMVFMLKCLFIFLIKSAITVLLYNNARKIQKINKIAQKLRNETRNDFIRKTVVKLPKTFLLYYSFPDKIINVSDYVIFAPF